ncbi:ImmA/IrrE family metallo-endopeptidase [Nevskia ramosa]|uniref:ImmA/IrrE family metallo-endopeptidase n=1 Tax=Nevskia ramosa TaxID=64002 RepID=UPI000686E20A|nr:hypothetical protein [Nevskia ramosa]
MRWITDKTKRFQQRPYYTEPELDLECERVISDFLRKKYGRVEYPISTDDLTVLIEKKADLDAYADLSGEGHDVEGVTEFRPGKRPMVKISEYFGDQASRENRLRTTLTHEFAHVHFHGIMFDSELQSCSLFPATTKPVINKCNRDSLLSAQETDWMEWQAGYACGALLMPISALNKVVLEFCANHSISPKGIGTLTALGQQLIAAVSMKFKTSNDAARVRLIKKGILVEGDRFPEGDLLS